MMEYLLHFDGSIGPDNPGTQAGYGFAIKRDNIAWYSEAGSLTGETYSNNYAEFWALYKGLDFLKDIIKPSDKLFIRGDSALVINTMGGRWKARHGVYYPAYLKAKEALTTIRSKHITVSIDWIPRNLNTEADALSTEYRQ